MNTYIHFADKLKQASQGLIAEKHREKVIKSKLANIQEIIKACNDKVAAMHKDMLLKDVVKGKRLESVEDLDIIIESVRVVCTCVYVCIYVCVFGCGHGRRL